MSRVELDIDTPLAPEQVISGLTDFSERRPEIWPGLHPDLYEVRSVGDTWAEVKEGSQAPGMTVWAIEGYDWSVAGTVKWTIKESNLFAPGGSVSAHIDPGPDGGSRIHVTWNRIGVGVKGRMLVGIIKLSGGKPVAVSIKQGLDRILESGRRPQSETTPALTSRDGTPIAYQRSGEGPPLVLVHGTSADHSRWKPVLPAFEEHFTVYAVDRRGRGDSGDSEDYSIEREFEDVAAVVDSIGEPVNLLGHSYGAVCALEAALLTRNVRKLVLYEPGMNMTGEQIYPPGLIDRLDALLEAGDRDAVISTMFRDLVGMSQEEVEYLRSLPAWQERVKAAHTVPRELRADERYHFASERFKDLSTPTLMLEGSDSPAFLKAADKVVDQALPNCRIVVMLGQGHAAMDTSTDLFTSEVLRFLKGS